MSPSGKSRSDSAESPKSKTGEGTPTSTEAGTSSPSVRKNIKKRTKTGCLTCRKRRIKCGEEKPVCKQCQKSRRFCEGYRHSFTFRRSQLDRSAYETNHISFAGRGGGIGGSHDRPFYNLARASTDLTAVAPFPSSASSYTDPRLLAMDHRLSMPLQMPGPVSLHPRSSSITSHPVQQYVPNRMMSNPGPTSFPNYSAGPVYHQTQTWYLPQSSPVEFNNSLPPTPSVAQMRNDYSPFSQASQDLGLGPTLRQAFPGPEPLFIDTSLTNSGLPSSASSTNSETLDPLSAPLSAASYAFDSAFDHPDDVQSLIEDAVVEMVDEDYYDIDTDDDELLKKQRAVPIRRNLPRSTTLAYTMQSLNFPPFLDHWRAEWTASPLRNPSTAAVFRHYVAFTGPMLSCFWRSPEQSIIGRNSDPLPPFLQNCITYTIPMLALHSQGLMHACLAVASLHIAKLHGASSTSSLKHYTYALRRVHSAVRRPDKRSHPAILPATLLLGFYEIMVADHVKWNAHLNGAAQLMREMDHLGKTRQLIARKRVRQASGLAGSPSLDPTTSTLDALADQFPTPNTKLLRAFTGGRINYEDEPHDCARADYSEFELGNFALQQELRWWFYKNDAIHSMISEGPAFLDFKRWTDIPPRSAFGETVVGSWDHFLLLLGRLANFVGKDKPRKLRVENKTAEESAREKQAACIKQPPSGSGDVPPLEASPVMPQAYMPLNEPLPPRTLIPFNDESLEEATKQATEEWTTLFEAYRLFIDTMSMYYKPMQSAAAQFMTPFGPSLQFERMDVGALWTWCYFGYILLLRIHPSMPSDPPSAVRSAASQTAHYANEIGRISYSILPDLSSVPQTCLTGGTFMEIAYPLYMAALQFKDQEQRTWTVHRIRQMERLSGWTTIGLFAIGCEGTWMKMAAMGEGPPYEAQKTEDGSVEDVPGEVEEADEPTPTEESSEDAKQKKGLISIHHGRQVTKAYSLYLPDGAKKVRSSKR